MKTKRNFSSELIIATMMLHKTQEILNKSGKSDISIAAILQSENAKTPQAIICKCREYVDWTDLNGKF